MSIEAIAIKGASVIIRVGRWLFRWLLEKSLDLIDRLLARSCKRIRRRKVQRYRRQLKRAKGAKRVRRLERRLAFHLKRIAVRKRVRAWIAKHREQWTDKGTSFAGDYLERVVARGKDAALQHLEQKPYPWEERAA